MLSGYVIFTALVCPVLTKVSNSRGWKCGAEVANGGIPFNTTCKSTCNTGYVPKTGTLSDIKCRTDKEGKKAVWPDNKLVCEGELSSPLQWSLLKYGESPYFGFDGGYTTLVIIINACYDQGAKLLAC